MANAHKYSVGSRHPTHLHGDIEIVELMNRNRAKVRFVNSGYTTTVSRQAINQGSIKDHSSVKYAKGTIHPTRNFGSVEVLERMPKSRFRIRFLNTGWETITSSKSLHQGYIADHSVPRDEFNKALMARVRALRKPRYSAIFTLGSVHPTYNYGEVTIIEILRPGHYKIRFHNTGSERDVVYDALREGHIRDYAAPLVSRGDGPQPTKYLAGETLETRHGPVTILSVEENSRRKIRFENTGTETTCSTASLREKSVTDCLVPTIKGIGYMGSYDIKPSDYKQEYTLWTGLLERLVSNPKYMDCTMDNDWYNFSLFIEQLKQIPRYQEWKESDGGMYHLDKDLRVPGSKHYGIDTCLFLSRFENTLEAHARSYLNNNPTVIPLDVQSSVMNLLENLRLHVLHG